MKKIIIANWKCNPTTIKEGKTILEKLKKLINANNKVIICPPSPFLGHFLGLYGNSFTFGAQNCFFEEKGAYTGEISPKMLQDIGCKYVIIGHSERRRIFKENDKDINLKLNIILNTTKLIPILCIGENREERKKNKTLDVFKKQLKDGLINIDNTKAKKIIIAYEPIWAIGTGVYAKENEIKEAKKDINQILCDIYGKTIDNQIKIIYGGSVDSNNISSILDTANMDGVLVGGASLKPENFSEISNFK